LGAGCCELNGKAPIEKWRKSQEVDTESVYFMGVSQNQKMRGKIVFGINMVGGGGEASRGSKIIIDIILS
jgi:hypothetical protein